MSGEFDASSNGGSTDYKIFGQFSRDRLLHEMLGSTKKGDSRSWKVLIMDKVTVKVMSHSCKMSDITDQGVSLVEDLFRRREPLPSMDAVYYIQPSKENIVMFLSDMSGREPLYRKAFLFFSSPLPKELVNRIKCDTSVLPRIGAMGEMNLEYFPIDSQAFVTDHERALEDLFGDVENTRKHDACLNTMASRIATVFASLKEHPCIRFRAARGVDESTSAMLRDQVPSKLASAVWDCISKYKSTIPNFPKTKTCELLILDRSIDQIAPVIHEWTYDAMIRDLLDVVDGNKYFVEVSSKAGGKAEKKEMLLGENDSIWLELRHTHIADASERLHDKMTNFVSNNKAAKLQQSAREGNDLSTRDLQKMVQALPQYTEQVEKISLHVEIAGKINTIIRDTGLRELGQLEQDLVFGDAGAKEVINFLRTKQDTSPENKLRLLMIFASVYPEKFEGDKGTMLMQLAKLSSEDMKIIHNMRLLGAPPKKKSASGFSLKFDAHKKTASARKDRIGEEEAWQLFRFYPMIEEVIENLSKGELPDSEYSCVNEPIETTKKANNEAKTISTQSSASPPGQTVGPHSSRSRRTANWARSRNAETNGSSSGTVSKTTPTDISKLGQRIFVFVIGGATRSELRVCHKLTAKLKREVILGSSSFDDPPQYITKLKMLLDGNLLLNGLKI